MKQYTPLVFALCLLAKSFAVWGQTNTFPSSGRVGIGTIYPMGVLDVIGSAANYTTTFYSSNLGPYMSHVHHGSTGNWYIRSAASNGTVVIQDTGGNLGVGTASPANKLQVVGAGSYNIDLCVNGRIITGDAANYGGMFVNSYQTMFVGQQSATTLGLYNGTWRFVVDNNGNVGIGTTSPNEKLTVNGKIYSKEVKVDLLVPGPDYVFEDSYNLPALEQLETYIDQNKHLPEVPSAAEMEKNGINVGEMNMLLLKKIEELTLYVIELKKEIITIKNRE